MPVAAKVSAPPVVEKVTLRCCQTVSAAPSPVIESSSVAPIERSMPLESAATKGRGD